MGKFYILIKNLMENLIENLIKKIELPVKEALLNKIKISCNEQL
jgi:hypothetical protein